MNGQPTRLHAYAPTAAHASDDRSLTVGLAVATSGAAASPNMGYHSSPTLTFLMTVFNVRLGWWLRNPRWPKVWERPSGRAVAARAAVRAAGDDHRRARSGCTSPTAATSRTSASTSWCGAAAASSSRATPARTARSPSATWATPSRSAARTSAWTSRSTSARSGPARGRTMSEWHCAVGSIRYDRQRREDVAGTLLYIKSSLTGDEPTDVLRYAAEHPAFPHESTNDQFFDESQFESYRALGYHIAHEVFGPALAKGAAETAAETMAGRPLAVQCARRAGALHPAEPGVGQARALAAQCDAPVFRGADPHLDHDARHRRNCGSSTTRCSRRCRASSACRSTCRPSCGRVAATRLAPASRELLAAAERRRAPGRVLHLQRDAAADGGRVPGVRPGPVPRPHRQPRLDEPVPALGLVGHAVRHVGDHRVRCSIRGSSASADRTWICVPACPEWRQRLRCCCRRGACGAGWTRPQSKPPRRVAGRGRPELLGGRARGQVPARHPPRVAEPVSRRRHRRKPTPLGRQPAPVQRGIPDWRPPAYRRRARASFSTTCASRTICARWAWRAIR